MKALDAQRNRVCPLIFSALGAMHPDRFSKLLKALQAGAIMLVVVTGAFVISHACFDLSDEARIARQFQQQQSELQETLRRAVSKRHQLEARAVQQEYSVRGASSQITADGIISIVSKLAQGTGIHVDEISRIEGLSSAGARSLDYRLTASGRFSELTTFIQSITTIGQRLITSECVVQNPLWPNYTGVVEARVVLRLSRP